MKLSSDLLDILVCPESKQPLLYFPTGETGEDEANAFLYCPNSRLRYRIQDGIPIMLVEEAERLDEQSGARLVEAAQRNA